MLMLQVRQLTIASHPLHSFWKARHPYNAPPFFKKFWAIILSSFLLPARACEQDNVIGLVSVYISESTVVLSM